ncbi:MAG: hypothetical protein ACRBBP_08330 [Bdellovibrionales bacterium]
MKSYSNTISLLAMGLILVLGFQNCSGSRFSDGDLVEDRLLSSIKPGDTKYKDGLSFDYLAKTDTNTVSEYKVQKKDNNVYLAQSGNDIITCSLQTPNPMEELMQITEVAKVTHPALLSNPEVCNPIDGKFIHYKIGEVSPIYLIASSEEDCLLDDPQRLLNENKRVFVIDNLSFEEIESLVNESKALSTNASCTVNQLNIED